MSDRTGKIASTCLTPSLATPRCAGLSLAGAVVMTLAAGGPADAKALISEVAPPAAVPQFDDAGPAIDAGELPAAGPLLFGPAIRDQYFLAQSFPDSPSFPGTLICNEGGECVTISFPHPTDDGTPPEDGGVPPQAGQPSLTTPDLLVSKPRVAPDLDGRFSNGGNEEIW